MTGWVPDMNAYLGRATLAVCPVHSGSGIQMKVQEAMVTGIPVVATSTANRGVGGTSWLPFVGRGQRRRICGSRNRTLQRPTSTNLHGVCGKGLRGAKLRAGSVTLNN